MFWRAKGSQNANNNALQACMTPFVFPGSLSRRRLIPQEVKDNLHAATDAAMGPTDEITPSPPLVMLMVLGPAVALITPNCCQLKSVAEWYLGAGAILKGCGPFSNDPFIMQQIPAHTCRVVKEYMGMLNISLLSLPGITPTTPSK
ncbi:hypothetical protein B0H16DRAFT_1480754 [Mycena metata]|uniref:Uncharacterized protein n=1 Tax=Mycena metata TaxID=1033252 RepID=A0AAD7MCL0_9AGAR|nr:hypothetical protein B0H16DRAFT_1480754 [Mycena metata]